MVTIALLDFLIALGMFFWHILLLSWTAERPKFWHVLLACAMVYALDAAL